MAETMIPMPGMEVEISVQGMQASRFEAIEAAEAARSTAETERESAESARANAEQARVNAESARNAAESGRKAAEKAREQNEAARVTAESARASAEQVRADAEAEREAAEAARASAETARAEAESGRVAAEAARASAETARAEAESGRVAAEKLRAETFAGYEGRLSAMDEAIASKADKTALALANRRLDALWKLSQGISYQFETDSNTAYQKTVPSGAKLANIDSIGGHTEAVDGALVSAGVESVKYNDTVVADIPAAVRALPGYGWSAGSAHNGIERTETGWRYVQRVGSVDLGTLGITPYSTMTAFITLVKPCAYKDNWTALNAVSDRFIVTYANHSNTSIERISATSANQLKFSSFNEFNTAQEFSDYLNGSILYYELETPIVTDITALMGDALDAIAVEGGGTLTFENAAQLAVPNSVEYAVALAEVNG